MFGRRYVVYERPSAGELFGSIMVFLVILALIISILWWIGVTALIVFLCIGGAIGLGYALFVYVRAFISSVSTVWGYTPNSSGVLMGTLEKLFVLSATSAQTAFQENLNVASGAITRSRAYGIISFRKWMWLVAALSVMVFGVALIIAVILLEFSLVLAVAAAFVGLIAALCALYIVAATFYALFFAGKIAVVAIRNNIDFTCFIFNTFATFGDWVHAFPASFKSLGMSVSELWSETLTLCRDNFTTALSMPLLSLLKWLYLVSPAPLVLWAGLFTALKCLVFGLVFLLVWLAQLVWTCIVKILHLFGI